ncbi:MAG: spore germination protein [Bacillota bacterium]|nr:spore germination protein [Bacillota bacterium]
MEKYNELLKEIKSRVPVGESFDILERKLTIGGRQATMFFVDGLVDGGMMQRLMFSLLSLKKQKLDEISSSEDFIKNCMPFLYDLVLDYVES